MSFGDRFKSWQADNATIEDYFQAPTTGNPGGTMWADNWYFGKNLGLDRFQALKFVPKVGGAAAAAAAILAGLSGNGAAAGRKEEAPPPPPAVDYTPLYFVAAAIALVAIVKK